MVKLLENTFRSVNIGLVNEIALMCGALSIDVWEVIDAAKTKPFGFMPFYPGPGLGGHCIPIDPFYLVVEGEDERLRRRASSSSPATINEAHAALRRREDHRRAQPTTARASAARASTCSASPTRRDVNDIRESPALHVMKMLIDKGAKVTYINFHIGSGDMSIFDAAYEGAGRHANYAGFGVQFGIGNVRVIANLITGGACHRFPNLKFVSVESGVGWIPFALEHLDWQWKNCGVPQEHPEYDLLPSEYFVRQMYGCFWFERLAVKAAIDALGPDWILYESDFPHPTSMAPGPASAAVEPRQYIADTLGDLPEHVLRKILHDNAALAVSPGLTTSSAGRRKQRAPTMPPAYRPPGPCPDVRSTIHRGRRPFARPSS